MSGSARSTLLVLFAGLLPVTFGQTSPFTFTTISYPGAAFTVVNGINNAGQLVGYYGVKGTPGVFGFLYSGSTFAAINYPSTTGTTIATGINDAGAIVGTYSPDGVVTEGFLYSGGTFTTINYPSAAGTTPTGINNAGQIVGSYLSGGESFGFLYSGGAFTTLDYPSANAATVPSAINNTGEIVGYYVINYVGSEMFVYSGGTYTTIYPYPLGISDGLITGGINDAGVIAGHYSGGDCAAENCGFLYSGGSFTSFTAPSSTVTNPVGINNTGQIVGGFDSGSFLATPAAPPTISSITPRLGFRVTGSVRVTIKGTNFFAGWTTVQASHSGVSVSNANVTSPTELTVTFTLASDASLGDCSVTVTTPSGASNALRFTVL